MLLGFPASGEWFACARGVLVLLALLRGEYGRVYWVGETRGVYPF